MRKRLIDPDFFSDDELALVSDRAKIMYLAMCGICDDNHATLPNKPNWIRSISHPYDTFDPVPALLELKDLAKKITLFVDSGKEYWYLQEFFHYQTVQWPSKSKYPAFTREKMLGEGLFELSPTVVLNESSMSPHANKLINKLIKTPEEIKKGQKGTKEKEEDNGKTIKQAKEGIVKTLQEIKNRKND